MTARPTAAPACWPYLEHRTQAEILSERPSIPPLVIHRLSPAEVLSRRIDSSTCFRCGARVGLCSHFPIHQPLPKSADAPASLTKPGDAGSLEEWLA